MQLDRTHTIAAQMGQGAPKDMLVTFVIGADDGLCQNNPIVTIIVRNKNFTKVVHCSQTWGSPLGSVAGSHSLLQTSPEKITRQFQLVDPIRLVWKPFGITPIFS